MVTTTGLKVMLGTIQVQRWAVIAYIYYTNNSLLVIILQKHFKLKVYIIVSIEKNCPSFVSPLNADPASSMDYLWSVLSGLED